MTIYPLFKIPNYDPREIVKNLRRMLNGLDPEEMTPWFKGFTGTIEGIGEQRYVVVHEQRWAILWITSCVNPRLFGYCARVLAT